MKDHTFDRSVQVSTQAAQPNFDDERTVQSARPVVPLEKINAKLRHRKQWFLGGAFALAMMLGAATALLASYLKLRNVTNSATEISQVEMATAPLAIAEPLASELPMLETSEELLTTAEPRKEPVVKRRTVTKRNADWGLPRAVPQLNEEDELNRIREAILYDQWQERRERRATRRERRMRLERYNHRDLSNLDEIFEGPRRKP
jgi:hypothetical protein